MENIVQPPTRNHAFHLLNIVVFTGFLSYFGLVFFMQQQQEVSIVEKRKLAIFPGFNTDSLRIGSYTKDIDLYVADHFPLRDYLVSFTFNIKNLRGYKTAETFYASEKKQQNIAEENLQLMDTSTALTAEEEFLEEDAQMQKGLLITESGRALQLFGGSDKKARAYADMISAYHEKLEEKVQVYNLVVPSGADFYLPKKHKDLYGKEKKHIDTIDSHLPEPVISIDLFNALKAHKKEYLFFKTDHHWTALGAYYAYEAFCEGAGLKAVPLDIMEHKSKPGFLGSLYALTRDAKLENNADTLHYYKVPHKCEVSFTTKDHQDKWGEGMLYAERAEGASLYSLFLGSDYPLMHIVSPFKNGRKAVVIKNSYGNAFVPYLTSHYEEVYVVDYRYYTKSLLALVSDQKINDLIFVIGSFSSNNADHINRIRKIMYGK